MVASRGGEENGNSRNLETEFAFKFQVAVPPFLRVPVRGSRKRQYDTQDGRV